MINLRLSTLSQLKQVKYLLLVNLLFSHSLLLWVLFLLVKIYTIIFQPELKITRGQYNSHNCTVQLVLGPKSLLAVGFHKFCFTL